MGFYIDLSKLVAVTDLEETAAFRRFGTFLGNNAQKLIFTGYRHNESWVNAHRHHEWLLMAWRGYELSHRTWSTKRFDAPLIHQIRNFHVSLLGVTCIGPIEDRAFDIYLYGRAEPLRVSTKTAEGVDRLKADRIALLMGWRELLPCVSNMADIDPELPVPVIPEPKFGVL